MFLRLIVVNFSISPAAFFFSDTLGAVKEACYVTTGCMRDDAATSLSKSYARAETFLFFVVVAPKVTLQVSLLALRPVYCTSR